MRFGFRTETIETEGHPMLWAVGPEVPGAPTVLCYGHYDVQPPDPLDDWITPPFEPTVRDGKLYARGTADDKGQVFAVVAAVEALLTTRGRLPVNVRFLIEGEEEVGSKGLTTFLTAQPDRTRADAVLVPDVNMVAPGWPSVDAGLRGMVAAEIHVRTLKKDLHSGIYGGAAPNAVETLWHLLERLKGPDGKIRIPGLYTRVKKPSAKELKAWKALPDQGGGVPQGGRCQGADGREGLPVPGAGVVAADLRGARHRRRLPGRRLQDRASRRKPRPRSRCGSSRTSAARRSRRCCRRR